jgi:hypothetical protein
LSDSRDDWLRAGADHVDITRDAAAQDLHARLEALDLDVQAFFGKVPQVAGQVDAHVGQVGRRDRHADHDMLGRDWLRRRLRSWWQCAACHHQQPQDQQR